MLMLMKAIFFCTYLILKAVLGVTAFFHPSFRKRLKERNLAFSVKIKTIPAACTFRLKGGKLFSDNRIDGFINFTAIWNGWGRADTIRKKLQLNPFDILNTGMITIEGDISSMDYLLILLGEMIKCYKKSRPAVLKRVEL